ncbi:MAG: Uma2 family endonuclease [Microcystis sp. M_QC_C_20170808_M2Col]|uniref:Uma2 family endonuclease n=1 Tax=Microcystis sp. M_QC_C_20170808_M2Col TaxID=2486215 RepID=UPI001192D648|nr:Uma2 family endonuclease [Microcystis sp. M_QC_C_20170808_M2Col]TRT64681.1 MAG: Uma2 family endonuclease [Microcystis sp. M_QC_C_20170808_M2Col]
MLLITLNENTLSLSPGSQVIFPHQTWEDYERLLSLRLQMSPLPSHGKRINLLSDLVKIILRRQGKDWECFDPITLKITGEAGVEPDSCFYIDNREAILGKERIDLTVDPPPDLAIEVDFTSLTDVEAYQLLKIPELWVYRREELKIYLFREDGYQESENSRLFPDINIKKLFPYYVELGWNQGSSLALRQFEALENFS